MDQLAPRAQQDTRVQPEQLATQEVLVSLVLPVLLELPAWLVQLEVLVVLE